MVKRREREADYSPQCSDECKIREVIFLFSIRLHHGKVCFLGLNPKSCVRELLQCDRQGKRRIGEE